MTITNEELKSLMANVSNIAANVKFPRDPWGFTSELKQELVKIAHKANTPEKSALLVGTLMVALAHVQKRKEKDQKTKADRLTLIQKQEDARKPFERFGSPTLPKENA